MSRKDKIIARLLSSPKDFSYSELKQLLTGLGYNELNQGKTSGSRVAFYNDKIKHIIRLHKPHPANILKTYQIELIIEELIKTGVINER